MTGKLVLLRHGQSTWNQDNLFTGWTDVDLTDQGRNEARNAGIALRDAGYEFDIAFTSVLKRAIRTLWIVLDEMDMMWLPVDRNWVLNERHYGSLQGSNKAETVVNYGMQKVQSWRRGYEAAAPGRRSASPALRPALFRNRRTAPPGYRISCDHTRAGSAALGKQYRATPAQR